MEEIDNGKQLVVHYHLLKRYHGVVAPTSKTPERNPIPKMFQPVNNLNGWTTSIVSI